MGWGSICIGELAGPVWSGPAGLEPDCIGLKWAEAGRAYLLEETRRRHEEVEKSGATMRWRQPFIFP